MALVLANRVQESATANTTVSFTLTGAILGFQTFAVIGDTNTTYYSATDSSGNWEVGLGTYSTTGPTLTRTTIYASSNSGSAVTFSGAVNVFVTYPSGKSVNLDAAGVAAIGDPISYSDTGIISTFASTVAGYNQVILQNKSNATNASANLNVSNDASTATTGYAELGINSSTFSNGPGCFNIPSASYLASASTDLSIGTYGPYNIHFATNSSTVDAMTIYNSGGVSLGGYADPGLGTLYANNIYIGFNTITASAGTTTLTNASAGYQQVVGTTTHTIQLPNATTLYKGLAFTIANNATGAVSIRDNASALIDTTVTGGSSILVLTDNTTVAGTWVAYSYVPSTYDFSTTTANFGNATITNATWNGNTIQPAYGGTGLTSFVGANNALYSTGATTLTAGTLPVAAGGTGITSFGTGVASALGTNVGTAGSFVVNGGALGTPSSGTLTNATGLPISSGVSGLGTGVATALAVNTGSAGSVVVNGGALGTPSSGTLTNATGLPLSTGVTGTLPVANGGTGLTAGTSGGVLYYSATGTLASSAALASNALVVGGGAGVAPSTITTGTGVVTALGVNTGSAGSFVVNGGALGTPSSGTVTNLTGTASININGTVGATTPNTGAFTTLTTAGNANLGNSATGQTYTTRFSGYGVDDGGLFGSYGTVLLNATSALTSGARRYMVTNALFGNTFAIIRSTNSTTDPTLGTTGTITSGTADFVLNNSGYAGFGTQTPFAKVEVTDTTGILTRAASTQDGVALVGRAGGTSSYTSTLTPTTLSANRTLTLPDNSGTVLTTGATVAVSNGGTGQTTYTDGQLLIGNSTGNTLTKATLTAGTGITVTNGSGSITVTNGGVTSITGTANQITASASTGGVTLSTPQSIGTASSVQFGSFGVGTAASGTSGEIRATNNITAYYSDDRLKTRLGRIENALDKLCSLEGFYYEANETAQAMGYEVKREVGVSAQQMQAVMPEVVAPAPIDDKYLTVRYERALPLLIEAIKELREEVRALKG